MKELKIEFIRGYSALFIIFLIPTIGYGVLYSKWIGVSMCVFALIGFAYHLCRESAEMQEVQEEIEYEETKNKYVGMIGRIHSRENLPEPPIPILKIIPPYITSEHLDKIKFDGVTYTKVAVECTCRCHTDGIIHLGRCCFDGVQFIYQKQTP